MLCHRVRAGRHFTRFGKHIMSSLDFDTYRMFLRHEPQPLKLNLCFNINLYQLHTMFKLSFELLLRLFIDGLWSPAGKGLTP